MTTFERKNAYVNGLKMFPSSFDDAKEVIRFTIKNEDIALLQTQLAAAATSGLPALVDITHSEQTGKFGTFRGGNIRVTARQPQKDAPTPVTAKNVTAIKSKQVG